MVVTTIDTSPTTQMHEPHILDHPTTHNPPTLLPSDVASPTRSNTLPQQGSTQPGDGDQVHFDTNPSDTTQPKRVPFKEKVIGVAKKTRGTLLGKPELKEHGEMILEGQVTHNQDPMDAARV